MSYRLKTWDDSWPLMMAEDIPPEALHSQDTHKTIPPLHGALLEIERDVHRFGRLVFMSRKNQ